MRSIPAHLAECAKRHADAVALRYPDGPDERREVTYGDLIEDVARFGRGLHRMGIRSGDRILLLADNSPRWLVANLGILWAGAVSVPRAADVTADEAGYILRHSGARAVIAANPRILDRLPTDRIHLEHRILLLGERPGTVTFESVLEEGQRGSRLPYPPGEIAKLVYTSGTTGVPKGVILSHENILHNVRTLPEPLNLGPGDRFLSVLPSWHMFECTVEYVVLAVGATLSYSSLRTLKKDLLSERPTLLVGVPRLWSSFGDAFQAGLSRKRGFGRKVADFLLRQALAHTDYVNLRAGRLHPDRDAVGGSLPPGLGAILTAPLGRLGRRIVGRPVREALGGRLKLAVSGGGRLPLHLDRLLQALGLNLLVGYGLTETSPVAALRDERDNVIGTIGRALPETEFRVVDPTGSALGPGETGELLVRGPQVMRGYYGDEEATRAAIDSEGWFRTGDLCSLTARGDLVFRGRTKETIVLAGGENVEPGPIETRILESPYISQAVVVGQDRKTLAALLVPDGNAARHAAEVRRVTVEELLQGEVRRLVCGATGFKSRELVGKVAVLDREFSIEDGTLTRTLKVRRPAVREKYADVIERLYGR